MSAPRCMTTAAIACALACGSVATFAHPGHSDVVPDTQVVRLPEEIVSALRSTEDARRLPAATFVLKRGELVARADARVSTLLANLPGLYAYRTGPGGEPLTVDPRGFTANGEVSYLKVLVDGNDVRDLENGFVDWDWVPPADIERVEVIEGPGAWLYGDGAEGGIVNIVRRAPLQGLEPFARLRLGDFENRGGELGLRGGRGEWSGLVSGRGRDVEGWRDRSAEQMRGGSVSLRRPLGGPIGLTLDVRWLDAEREEPGSLTPEAFYADPAEAETPIDFTNQERSAVALTLTHSNVMGGELKLAPFARRELTEQIRTIFFDPSRHRSDGTSIGGELSWSRVFAPMQHALRLDLGYQVDRGELETEWDNREFFGFFPNRTAGTGTRLSHSLFSALRWDATPALVARAGLRGDWLSVEFEPDATSSPVPPEVPARTLSATSPFLAVTHALGDRAHAYASVSGAFHAPTLNQLFDPHAFPALFPPGYILISNGSLEPQRATSFEVGARWDDESGASAALTLYHVSVKDEIDFDVSTFQYGNIGKSLHQGALARVRCPLPMGLMAELDGTVSPTTIRDGSLDGNQINAVPKGHASGRLAWRCEDRFALDAGARWVARQFLDKENVYPLGEYTALDLGGSARVSRTRVSLRVLNLLDRRYADTGFLGAFGEERWIPAAPRTVVASLSFE
ncbi:MAG: TonB-dependent receptor [Candidatus Eisenbacteria bacterium]|uniref:TonB-dependent receptor n=1 Tax=Eiseniibacteriota bacterium TaxID=2212470 RepID=A0A849SGA2_UNCEI|nr:TonB-dependent receptor [Candidatus Eisenbacteria bacterium]